MTRTGAVLLGAVLAAGVGLKAQAVTGSAFEVESIKRNESLERGNAGFYPGGRFRAVNVPGVRLVSMAYGTPRRTLLDYQIDGVPGWLRSERYDVTAKLRADLAGPDDTAAAHWRHLQSLLLERFKLQVHHESRELPRYRLVQARRDGTLGPRLRRASVDCTVTPASSACKLEYLAGHLIFDGFPIGRFADDLSGTLGRVVVDDTSLAGPFDLDVEWSPDQSSPDRPSIFTAVQEQLGLKLDAERGPVDVVVIDHIERPTED